jgi:uncharacterized membrane protein (UPF0127 family)
MNIQFFSVQKQHHFLVLLAPQTFALMFWLHAKSTQSSIMHNFVIIILDHVFVTCGGIEFLELLTTTY